MESYFTARGRGCLTILYNITDILFSFSFFWLNSFFISPTTTVLDSHHNQSNSILYSILKGCQVSALLQQPKLQSPPIKVFPKRPYLLHIAPSINFNASLASYQLLAHNKEAFLLINVCLRYFFKPTYCQGRAIAQHSRKLKKLERFYILNGFFSNIH